MKNILFVLFAIPISFVFAYSIDKEAFEIGKCYVIRLTNGDMLEGVVQSFQKDDEGESIRFESEIGVGNIYFSQIAESYECEQYYRFAHKYFLLPTAIGIGKNHFVGMLELFFFYSGFGLTDYFSIVIGRSLLPNAYSNQQISLLNIKGTLPKVVFEDIPRELYLAIGGNLGFANNNNRFIHFYGVATALFYKTSLSACLFYKLGSGDFYTIRYRTSAFDLNYSDGAFGIALGVDSRLPKFRDIHIIGELWNNDIARPTNSGLFLGIRIANAHFCSDFGLSWFTQPFVVPIVNFQWIPF